MTIEEYTRQFHDLFTERCEAEGLKEIADIVRTDQSFDVGRDTVSLRQTLIEEETAELIEALEEDNPEAVMKEAVDVMFVVAALFSLYGWDYEEAVKRVAENNIAKLKNGSIRNDGKILKPEDHPAVELRDLV